MIHNVLKSNVAKIICLLTTFIQNLKFLLRGQQYCLSLSTRFYLLLYHFPLLPDLQRMAHFISEYWKIYNFCPIPMKVGKTRLLGDYMVSHSDPSTSIAYLAFQGNLGFASWSYITQGGKSFIFLSLIPFEKLDENEKHFVERHLELITSLQSFS